MEAASGDKKSYFLSRMGILFQNVGYVNPYDHVEISDPCGDRPALDTPGMGGAGIVRIIVNSYSVEFPQSICGLTKGGHTSHVSSGSQLANGYQWFPGFCRRSGLFETSLTAVRNSSGQAKHPHCTNKVE